MQFESLFRQQMTDYRRI